MNPLGTVQDGGTRMPSVVNQQVTAVMPLWRAAEIFGLNLAPALGEPGARSVDLTRGALR
ncbi:hypothetical protein ACFYXF_06530 [Streptomyces sp. NPDC002680]|uniref:hypothetical protein n=1 Tax=Streptomyces sp. NPDC002680 TaxID=3364659 RepID=UPI0036CA9B6B